MKRYLILLIALAMLTLFIPACGGGGGGGGGGATIGSTNVLKEIALFADPFYLDYLPGDFTAEASNLEAALRDMGHSVTPFKGSTAADFSNALSGKEVLVIPYLQNRNLNAAMTTLARSVISDFVNAGGILISSGFIYNLNLLNDVFGFSILTAGTGTLPINLDTAAAVGTPFEDVLPQTLPNLNGAGIADSLSLPASARRLYTLSNGNSMLTYIPVGYGHIVILGWDWFNAKPVGTTGKGWWNVLYRAASLNATHPDAAVMHSEPTSTWTNDIVTKIKHTGQFGSVSSIDVRTSTPTLSTLQAYDAVLISPWLAFSDATTLGNNLANYIDGGGGVVLAAFSFSPSYSLKGNFLSYNYYTIPEGAGQTSVSSAVLGTNFYSSHPTMSGVQTFIGGTSSYRADTTSVIPGAARIANWDDGRTFLATREINGVRTANLGFYPVSVDVQSDFWDTTTDGDLLMANALTWVSDLPEPNYSTTISSDSFPRLFGGITIPGSCVPLPVTSTLTVSGGPVSISKVKLNLNITHPNVSDVRITLASPTATNVWISTNNGQTGYDYSNVTFDDAAGIAIEGLDATFTPFTGTFIPEEPLINFRGEDANGDWTLTVSDNICALNNGTLNGWGISVR